MPIDDASEAPVCDNAPFAEPLAPGRNPGQFVRGEPGPALKLGDRSLLRRQVQIEARRGGLEPERAAIIADLGGAENVSNLKARLVDRYLETSLIAEWLGGNLLVDGVLTTKGKTRAAATLYLQVVDRVHRLSMALGLERRARDISQLSPAEWVREQEAVQARQDASGAAIADAPDREGLPAADRAREPEDA